MPAAESDSAQPAAAPPSRRAADPPARRAPQAGCSQSGSVAQAATLPHQELVELPSRVHAPLREPAAGLPRWRSRSTTGTRPLRLTRSAPFAFGHPDRLSAVLGG